ncbi:MAG TPA: hypothetical protein DCX07_12920 [Phycisphaerales bacterium]|nr:hypothetical protein [Phycisphaerales bacterium]
MAGPAAGPAGRCARLPGRIHRHMRNPTRQSAGVSRRVAIACRPRGFTLIELLVVVAILSLLVSILMPSLRKARELAMVAVCLSGQHAVGVALSLYANDNDGIIANTGNQSVPKYVTWWWYEFYLPPYASGYLSASQSGPPHCPKNNEKSPGCLGMYCVFGGGAYSNPSVYRDATFMIRRSWDGGLFYGFRRDDNPTPAEFCMVADTSAGDGSAGKAKVDEGSPQFLARMTWSDSYRNQQSAWLAHETGTAALMGDGHAELCDPYRLLTLHNSIVTTLPGTQGIRVWKEQDGTLVVN